MRSKPQHDRKYQRIAPSFAGCQPASAESSRVKRRNRKVGAKGEIALRKALWRRGLRYRINHKGLPGTPDIVFSKQRIAIFVDGDFWHGRDWEARSERLRFGTNGAYWVEKIAYNRARDLRNDALLADLGWKVIRLWETDVLGDPESAADTVVIAVAS